MRVGGGGISAPAKEIPMSPIGQAMVDATSTKECPPGTALGQCLPVSVLVKVMGYLEPADARKLALDVEGGRLRGQVAVEDFKFWSEFAPKLVTDLALVYGDGYCSS